MNAQTWPAQEPDRPSGTAEPDAPPGSFRGPYRLLETIGSGGMGVIWRAEDIRLGRTVALKLLSAELARDPGSKARFLQEARTASTLDHVNVCSIYEVGETADFQLYLAMPFYEGETLEERIDRGPLGISEVIDAALQTARGLGKAHQRGIVHRDVKPSNLMITGDGVVKILDFGIAKLANDTSGPTRNGAVVGTLAYMSPEQMAGRPVDSRTDLWSLGVVIYEALTGCQPFSSENAAAARSAILHSEPVPLRRLRPDVPAKLDRLVSSLLKKDPADRLPSAESVETALRSLSGGRFRPDQARRVSIPLITLALALVVAAAFTLPNLSRTAETQASPSPGRPAPDRRRSVAVLGFRNLSTSTTQQWLGPALTEMLTAELAAGTKLRVVSSERTSRAQRSLSLPEGGNPDRTSMERLHALMGADFAVNGAFLPLDDREGRQIRLDIRILTMPEGDTVASVVEAGQETELFELVARAGARLRSALGFSMPTAAERLLTRGLLPAGAEAIRLYVEALSRLRAFDPVAARNLLERADSLEPGSVAIQTAFSETWMMMGQDTRAREAALKAFKARGSLPQEAQLTIEARFHETGKEWDRAAESYRTLGSLFPDELDYGLKLAETLSIAGHGHEALAVLDRLRKRPAPEGEDPRIDTTECAAAWRLFDLARVSRAARATVLKGRRLGAWLITARGLIYQSNVAATAGRTQEALKLLGQAEELALRAGDPWTAARVDANLGALMQQLGDLDRAEQVHRRALATARQLDTALGISVQLFYLGQIQRERGHLQEARTLLEESLERFRRIDYRLWEGQTQAELAAIHLHMGDLEGARQLLTDALAASRLIRRRDNEAQALRALAELEAREGRLPEALRLEEGALQTLLKLSNPRVAAEVLGSSADLLARAGDLPLARRRLLQAERAGHHAADRLLFIRLRGTRARLALQAGDLAAARTASQEQLQWARQSQARPLEVDALQNLARVARAAGEIRQARERLLEALRISTECGDQLTRSAVAMELAGLGRQASAVQSGV